MKKYIIKGHDAGFSAWLFLDDRVFQSEMQSSRNYPYNARNGHMHISGDAEKFQLFTCDFIHWKWVVLVLRTGVGTPDPGVSVLSRFSGLPDMLLSA